MTCHCKQLYRPSHTKSTVLSGSMQATAFQSVEESTSLNERYLANSHPAGVMPSEANSLAATACFLVLCKCCSLLRPSNDTAAHHMISRVMTRTQIPMKAPQVMDGKADPAGQ